MTFTVKEYLSPYGPPAVGGGSLSQKPTVTDWPMPAGLGATLTKQYIWICHGGVCAPAFCISTVEVPIDAVKIAAIKIAIVFVFCFCIFLFLSLIFV
jgi:hypothetical protein